jgi:hypothetical protein
MKLRPGRRYGSGGRVALKRKGRARDRRPQRSSEETRTMAFHRSLAGLAFASLALAACEHLPYYDESLDWFSRSRYGAEVEAIEKRTPPPQDSPVLSPPGGDAAMTDPGAGAITPAAGPDVDPAAPLPAVSGQAAGEGVTARRERAVTTAALPPRTRITPPMGFARSKRVIYGANRGPFAAGNPRTR